VIDLSSVHRDPYDTLYDGAAEGSDGRFGRKAVKGFAIKISDVPNFENLFDPTVIRIDALEAGE